MSHAFDIININIVLIFIIESKLFYKRQIIVSFINCEFKKKLKQKSKKKEKNRIINHF